MGLAKGIQSNNNGINLFYHSSNIIISKNNIKNSGVHPGMGQSGTGNYTGIVTVSNIGVLIEKNKVIKSGYNGIFFMSGDSIMVKENVVDTFCTVLQDGGGIYTSYTNYKSAEILKNIVLNGIGASDGTNDLNYTPANGIYIDANSTNLSLLYNTVANCADQGLFIHNSKNILLRGNTAYNNAVQLGIQYSPGYFEVSGCDIKNNIFLSKSAPQWAAKYAMWGIVSPAAGNALLLNMGSFDSNYYARPISENLVLNLLQEGISRHWGVSQWVSFSGQDVHSKSSPKTIADTNDLRFEYNASDSDKIIDLGAKYIDVTKRSYTGTFTLKPYSSVILIKSGAIANMLPNAGAGADQTITLPKNTISLSASGDDSDGTIVSNTWTKISGPSSYKIVNAASAITDVTGLVQGIYLFEIKIIDNDGAVARDTMQVTVNTIVNIPPKANAGEDITITLPVNYTHLNGNGIDADGTIIGYEWKQVSVPASASLVPDNTPETVVKGLVAGSYQFELTAKDNGGATAKDTVEVVVALPRLSTQQSNSIKIYPNPVSDFATLEIKHERLDSTILIVITSSVGKKVYSSTKRIYLDNCAKITDIPVLAKGVYTVEVYINSKEKQSVKMVRL